MDTPRIVVEKIQILASELIASGLIDRTSNQFQTAEDVLLALSTFKRLNKDFVRSLIKLSASERVMRNLNRRCKQGKQKTHKRRRHLLFSTDFFLFIDTVFRTTDNLPTND